MSNSWPTRARSTRDKCWACAPTKVARFPETWSAIQRLTDFPNLWRYTRDLHATPGIAATVKPRLYVQNYYSLARVNPNGIIPRGTPVNFEAAPVRDAARA